MVHGNMLLRISSVQEHSGPYSWPAGIPAPAHMMEAAYTWAIWKELIFRAALLNCSSVAGPMTDLGRRGGGGGSKQ